MLWGQVSRKSSARAQKLISRIYDTVHLALWACLIAFLIFFSLVVLPQVPQTRAKFEAERILELQAENDAYCDKWGFPRGARKHDECLLDLQELRAKIDQRRSDEIFP